MDLPLELLELSLIERGLRHRNLTPKPYLEVGCGDGFNMERFSRMGMRGAGIDMSAEAVEALQSKNLAGVQVLLGDFLQQADFPFKPEVVFMLNILEHIQDDAPFVQKAFSLLPPGGYLVVATVANQRAFGFADANAGHVRRYEKKQLEATLQQAGFTLDESLTVGFPVNRTYTWLFNFLNRHKSKTTDESKTALSGIRLRQSYYGGVYDMVAKVAFPILRVVIQIDRLFVHTNLGNNLVIFAKK